METKTFSIVTSIAMILAVSAAILSIIGISFTGFYPAVIVLVLLALIPAGSRFYAKRIVGRPGGFKRSYYTALTIFNVLVILIVLWIAFVVVHDRVLGDCC